MSTDLRDTLHRRLDHLPAPPGDLELVHRRGRRIRTVRRSVAVGVSGVAVLGVLAALVLPGGHGDHGRDRGAEPIGRLDVSGGLRAYAAPGAEIHLGGRSFPAGRIDGLDTDAAATPYGVLFYRAGVPWLLQTSGDVEELEPEAQRTAESPTAKVDSQGPLVAYGARLPAGPAVLVRNLETGELVGERTAPSGVVIDAIDGGAVFLRTAAGTTVWDTATGTVRDLAGPDTRVADVRGGVLLYDGPRPTGPAASGYRLVAGAIDAQLTFDGRHVLYWSGRLEATDGGRPIVLDLPRSQGWFAIDTDGSVLAALPGRGATNRVYDCEVPSGACTELEPLTTTSGDPAFIGVDM